MLFSLTNTSFHPPAPPPIGSGWWKQATLPPLLLNRIFSPDEKLPSSFLHRNLGIIVHWQCRCYSPVFQSSGHSWTRSAIWTRNKHRQQHACHDPRKPSGRYSGEDYDSSNGRTLRVNDRAVPRRHTYPTSFGLPSPIGRSRQLHSGKHGATCTEWVRLCTRPHRPH